MRRDISGAVMRLEIAQGLLFAGLDDKAAEPFASGKRLFDEAMALLKPAPGTSEGKSRKSRTGKGKGEPGTEDSIEQARRQVG